MERVDLIVRGTVVLPGGNTVDGEVVVREGRIVAAGAVDGQWEALRA